MFSFIQGKATHGGVWFMFVTSVFFLERWPTLRVYVHPELATCTSVIQHFSIAGGSAKQKKLATFFHVVTSCRLLE
jgi:transposase InsO family protein